MNTRETQYQRCVELRESEGLTPLGLMSNQTWHDDPKRLVFVLSRYKFVSRMLAGKDRVLEVGCADAFGTRIVVANVGSLLAVDFDPVFVQDATERMDRHWQFRIQQHDMVAGPVAGPFDAAYALDVIEHIQPDDESAFVGNIVASLTDQGVLILGTPSLQSQQYASPISKEGHVNCKDAEGLSSLARQYFENVFVFSMNDEVVHTGYYPMAHYLFALCVGRRR